MNALLLFSHGSLLCGAGEALNAHAARLKAGGNWDYVGVGYLNYSEPPFADAADAAIEAGATHITVLPYFLAPGYFVSKSLPDAVNAARSAHPNIPFAIAPPLGKSESLVDALLLAAQTARPEENWNDDLLQATNFCRPSSECPLYQTPLCPKAPGDKKVGDEK